MALPVGPDDAGEKERWFERSLDQRIKLPGALQNEGFGDDITVDTQWTGVTGLDVWLNSPQYAKYRQPGNIKVPFFLQPEKHYVGAAWYQRDVEIPAAWQGKRVVLSLERPTGKRAFGWMAGRSAPIPASPRPTPMTSAPASPRASIP